MTVRTLLWIVGAMAIALSFELGQAQNPPDEPVGKPSFVIRTFPVVSGSELPPPPLREGTVSLIGEPDSKSFGASFNGTLTTNASLSGKEKLVATLYVHCDGEKPGSRIAVGTVDLGLLKQAQPVPAVLATGDATAFVPLDSIKCIALAIRNDEPDKAAFIVKTFTEKDIDVAQDVTVQNGTVSLIGEPDSKSFGVSYRGTLTPAIELSGEEALVAHLYMRCDKKLPSETSAINVGTAKIGEVKKGRDSSFRIVTTDVTAFVPLKDVECVKLRLQ